MNKKYPKIVFMGTPQFAVPAMTAIYNKFGLEAVVTVPDKAQGRGRHLIPSPIKEAATELGIKILQPEKLRDELFISDLKEINPDIIVVIAFRILPDVVYKLPGLASFNIHGSLLPKYRGAAPINWAIINGEKETGLTSFLLADKVDTGSVLLNKKVEIYDGMTAGELHDLLMPLAAELSLETINLLLSGKFTPVLQDDNLASPAPKIFPDDCKIDCNKDAKQLKNLIHGVSPVPGAWLTWNDLRLKIYRVAASNRKNLLPFEYSTDNNEFVFGCLNGALQILELQLQGGRKVSAAEFLRGYRAEKNGFFNN